MADFLYGPTQKPTPTAMARTLVDPNSGVLPSALSSGMQRIKRAGTRWELEVVWENVHGDELAELLAILSAAQRPDNTLSMYSFDWVQRGAGGGTPQVDGANQVGNRLSVKGLPPSTTGYLRAGDYFSLLFGEVYETRRLELDVNSNATGNATLDFTPEIRQSPANDQAVVVVTTYTTCLVDGPVINQRNTRDNFRGGSDVTSTITVRLVEVVNGA